MILTLLSVLACISVQANQLMEYAFNGDLAGVTREIASGAEVNGDTEGSLFDDECEQEGYTALSYAVSEGHADVVKFLLEHGAHTKLRDNHGLTPLGQASDMGRLDIVKLLVAAGADVDGGEHKPLMLAASHADIPMLEYLLENGADLDARSEHYTTQTALTIALEEDQIEAVKYLLNRGSPPHFKNLLTSGFLITSQSGKLRLSKAGKARLKRIVIPDEEIAEFNATDSNSYVSPQQCAEDRATAHDIYYADLIAKSNTKSAQFIREAARFLQDPLANSERFKNKPALKQRLIWSIAYKLDTAYEAIKDLRSDWFTHPKMIAKLFLHACKVGNSFVAADTLGKLKHLVSPEKLRLICFVAFRDLSRFDSCQTLKHEIAAEVLAGG